MPTANDEQATVESDPDPGSGPPGTDPTSGAGAPTGQGRRRWIVVATVIVASILVIAGAWLVFGGGGAQERSEDDARKRLADTATAPAGPARPGAAPLTSPPAPGLYRFTGTGREHTTLPPLTEEQGPNMPATVVPDGDGCWVLQVDYNTHHWQSWSYCAVDGELRERRGATFSRRKIGTVDLDNTSTFHCDPVAVVLRADDAPGTVRPRTCKGTGSLLPEETVVTGTMTVVGRETVDVGGRPVETVHVRNDLTMSGAQVGTERTDQWFEATTGMLVRNEHQIRADADTPIGQVTYTEDSELTLQSLDPS